MNENIFNVNDLPDILAEQIEIFLDKGDDIAEILLTSSDSQKHIVTAAHLHARMISTIMYAHEFNDEMITKHLDDICETLKRNVRDQIRCYRENS